MYILIAVICLVACFVGIVAYGLWEKRSIRRRVEKLGTLLVTNKNQGVIAVCRKVDFDVALAKYWQKVYEGSVKSTDRISVRVSPTFTFYEESRLERPVHSGPAEALRQLEVDLILKATGFRIQYCDRWLAYPLVQEDGRLFVPFSADNTSDQLGFYDVTTVEEARAHLLQVLP